MRLVGIPRIYTTSAIALEKKVLRRAAKVDANHAALREQVRAVPGFQWHDTYMVGGGFPDAVVSGRHVDGYWLAVFVEVKQDGKEDALTPAEVVWWEAFTGPGVIASRLEHILAAFGR